MFVLGVSPRRVITIREDHYVVVRNTKMLTLKLNVFTFKYSKKNLNAHNYNM
jgi:hypothetical protein